MRATDRFFSPCCAGKLQAVSSLAALAAVVTVSHAAGAFAQTDIRTDSSWGRTPAILRPTGTNTTVIGNRGTSYSVPGDLYTITERQGRVAGPNLFHSFERFSVGTNDGAVFTTNTAALKNVISRVSGNSPTTINGLLALKPESGSNPNFFFVNPNGITFGASAQVDVPGAFHASTANHLRMGDTMFRAGNGSDSTLTIAAPEAFGFVGTTRAPLEVRGSLRTSGHPLSVFGGDVRIDAGVLRTEDGGDLRVMAIGPDPVQIPLGGSLPVGHGTLEVLDGALVRTSTAGMHDGGSIALSAGNVTIGSSGEFLPETSVLSEALSDSRGNGGTIAVNAADHLSIVNSGNISSRTSGSGAGGKIGIDAKSLTIQGSLSTFAEGPTGIFTETSLGSGNAGAIDVHVGDQLPLSEEGIISSRTSGPGAAGAIDILASSLAINGAGVLSSSTSSQAGSVSITASRLELAKGRIAIESWDLADLAAATPRLTIVSPDGVNGLSITGDGTGNISTTTSGSANAGDIDIVASALTLQGVKVSSESQAFATGSPGKVTFAVTGDICFGFTCGQTDIQIDSSWGRPARALRAGNRRTTLAGNTGVQHLVPGDVYTIPEDVGQVLGTNLFHSFGTFMLGSGDAAVFTTSSSLDNVISRVSGTVATRMDGLLLLSAAGDTKPNFFFINPNGITFGEGARVDVPAALHLSTANALKLSDGTLFEAGKGPDATLSLSAPQAFGFLGTPVASVIAVTGGAELRAFASLLSVVGGDIRIDGGHLVSDVGDVQVVAVGADAVDIPLHGDLLPVHGNLEIRNHGVIEKDGGNLAVSAGNIVVDNHDLLFLSTGILSSGEIRIQAHSMTIEGGQSTVSGGTVVAVNVTDRLSILERGTIFGGRGTMFGGTIAIQANSLSIDRSSVDGSVVTVNLTGHLSLIDRGSISARTIVVQANSVDIDGKGSQTTGVFGSDSVSIITDQLVLREEGRISILTSGSTPPMLTIVSPDIVLDSGSAIETVTRGDVDGGKIVAMPSSGGPGSLSITGDLSGRIATTTSDRANAGDIEIRASALTLQGVKVSSEAEAEATGSPGKVTFAVTGDICFGFTCGQTDIQIDSSWGRPARALRAGNRRTTLAGNTGVQHFVPGDVYTIPEDVGRVLGTNLFHSFGTFMLGSGDAALFTTTSPLDNVISRVSGTAPSRIDGLLLLSSTGDTKPNFFFVNPNGLTFGDGARVDVPAALHVSTANRLKFARGTQFEAGKGPDATLNASPPHAFGFLGVPLAAGITLTGDAELRTFGRPLSVVGGDIRIDGGQLISDDGDVRVVAVGTEAVDIPSHGDLPAVRGRFEIVKGGVIRASAVARQDSGTIAVQAGNVVIDGQGTQTGIFTQWGEGGSSGDAGTITINATEHLSILNAGIISTDALGFGVGGNIRIQAKSLTIDDSQAPPLSRGVFTPGDFLGTTGIAIRTSSESVNVGDIAVDVTDDLTIVHNGLVWSDAAFGNREGSIDIRANSLTIIGTGFVDVINPSARLHGSAIVVNVKDHVSIVDGGSILGTFVDVNANAFTIRGGSVDSSPPFSGGAHIAIKVSDTLSLTNGGKISSENDTFEPNAAAIRIDAGSIIVDGALAPSPGRISGISSGISPDRFSAPIRPGPITVHARGRLSLLNGGFISSRSSDLSLTEGNVLAISAGEILIDGPSSGIFAEIATKASGQGADVTVTALNGLTLADGGGLSIQNFAEVRDLSRLHSGTLSVTAPTITMTGGAKITAETVGTVAAGNVVLTPRADGSGDLSISGDGTGEITSSTRLPTPDEVRKSLNPVVSFPLPIHAGFGNAGDVEIRASNLALSGVNVVSEAKPGTRGAAGSVRVAVTGNISTLNGARIATDTAGVGSAGSVTIAARNLWLDASEISSTARTGSTGDAGSVSINSRETLRLTAGGVVSSSTQSAVGQGGEVIASAAQIDVDGAASGIRAEAAEGSSGQTGGVTITGLDRITLSNGGSLSIRNDATVVAPITLTPSVLSVTAPEISLKDATITAGATGNADASDIQIRFTDRMVVDPSSITTSAGEGDGGDIDIAGQGLLWLEHSQVTTSVLGLSGNGGDIRVAAHTLIMDSGFIQANTAAPQAQGGNVSIDVGLLLPSGVLLVGGDRPLAFDPRLAGVNVIQAAAPEGVAGNISLATPALDVAGTLSALSGEIVVPAPLTRDLCRRGAGSSFTSVGRGGMRPSTSGMIRPEGTLPAHAGAASMPEITADAFQSQPVWLAACGEQRE